MTIQLPAETRDMFAQFGRGLQHHGLRRANQRAVLTIIAVNPGISNAGIARASGLAPQTVSAILNEIDQAGLITRGQVLRGRRGQPATPIFMRAEGAYAIGCEVGWRHMDVVLVDLAVNRLGHVHAEYDYPDARRIGTDIALAVGRLMDGLAPEQRARIAGAGIAMPGDLARNLHLVGAPPEQAGLWQRLDLAGTLARATGLEVSVFNDGNAACWAELVRFPPPRPSDFIYLLVSRYIAAGIVGQGMLWEGPSGNSANLGSMLVNDGGERPEVVHLVASITALQQRLAAAGRPVPEGDPAGWDWSGFEPVLSEWIEAAAAALARVVFNTAAVIESRLAVVDGIMPRPVVERLVARIAAHLAGLPPTHIVPPRVMPGHLGAVAPAMGAAELPLYKRYFSRTLADITG